MMRWLSLAAALVVSGCSPVGNPRVDLTLATTTSTRDTGLLDDLVPLFQEETGLHVKVVAVGSGQALELGQRGDADVLLTHAPQAERAFVAAGHGRSRRGVMRNDFVLVGPQVDPAMVGERRSILDAFRRIARSRSAFISRGDDSGTHMKETALWELAGVEPRQPWYREAGSGMAQVLRMASELQAYTLTDRGTFLTQRGRLDLEILGSGDQLLDNPYSVIVVSSAKHTQVHESGAQKFADFLTSPLVQRRIGEFGKDAYGEPLFHPELDAEPAADPQ